MTITRSILSATTALTLSMGAAYADSNTLFLDQDGDGNTASIQQDTGVGGNDFGTSGNHALQQGNGNLMSYYNFASGNNAAGDNDILEAKQFGDDNGMYFNDAGGGSYGNRTNSVIQTGDDNSAQVRHNAADGGTVETVEQTGDKNYLAIYQRAGDGNSVGIVRQIGDNNGLSPNGYDKRGTYIYQHQGDDNRVDEASIIGNNNKGASGGLVGNVQRALYIEQNGSNNGLTSSTAVMYGENNDINVVQTGDWNNFNVIQGNTLVGGIGNVADLAQTGSYNSAEVSQDGSGNYVTAVQNNDGNQLTATFTGNDNGVGTMDGVAGALADLSATDDLFQGNIFQDSTTGASGNTISYVVNGNNNLFAFAQIGGANTIDGQVGNAGASNGNQVAVLQNGSGNGTTFTQNGGGNNNLAVSQ